MSRIIANRSAKIFTESFGSLADTPVLLIAGAMAPAVFWNDRFCKTLSEKGFLVIRFDHRDIGQSTHFPQSSPESGIPLPYSIDDLVEDAAAVLESYTTKQAHLVGHSLGGSLAQLFSIKHPDKTLSVTAISSPILAYGAVPYIETDPAITEELWKVLMTNPMHQDFERGAPEFSKVWRYLNAGWPMDESMATEYTEALYKTEIIGPAWNHTKVQEGIRDILPQLEQLTCPILYIHGEHDYLPSNPENTRRLANHLQNAKVFILKRGGHMFFNTDIWEILLQQILENFSRSTDGLNTKTI